MRTSAYRQYAQLTKISVHYHKVSFKSVVSHSTVLYLVNVMYLANKISQNLDNLVIRINFDAYLTLLISDFNNQET